MYTVEVCSRTEKSELFPRGKIIHTYTLYNSFEYALGDILDVDSELYAHLPDSLRADFSHPHIKAYSGVADSSGRGFLDDFTFSYDNGVFVNIGQSYIEDWKCE